MVPSIQKGGAPTTYVVKHLNARDCYFIAEQPAPAPHLAYPEGCAGLRNVLITVPRVSRSCEHFPDGFDLHLLQSERHKPRVPHQAEVHLRWKPHNLEPRSQRYLAHKKHPPGITRVPEA